MTSIRNQHSGDPREELRDCIEKMRSAAKLPKYYVDSLDTLATNDRMPDFWRWLSVERSKSGTKIGNLLLVCGAIIRSAELPSKPGNLTPKEREEYLVEVRKHVDRLKDLLSGTMFDSQEMSGLFDQPESNLMEELSAVFDWTLWDDKWDGKLYSSSAPIVQANSKGVRVNHFVCMVQDWFANRQVKIPPSILASLANVALNMDGNELVDEDEVRKKIQRFRSRKKIQD